MERMIVGGGCFWCVEGAYKQIHGVIMRFGSFFGDGRTTSTHLFRHTPAVLTFWLTLARNTSSRGFTIAIVIYWMIAYLAKPLQIVGSSPTSSSPTCLA